MNSHLHATRQARRLAAKHGRLHLAAHRCLVFLTHLKFLVLQAARTVKAVGYRWERRAKRWSQTHPYALLAAFPIWGDPKSFPIPPKARLRDAIRDAFKGSWPLVTVAVAPWAIAYDQYRSMFFDTTEDRIVAELGQVAFENMSTWLEISTYVFPAVAYLGIVAISLMCALVYRLQVVITHLDWRAKPRVGFRFHLTQVASMALYLGLPTQAVAWTMNHRSFAEPWIQVIASSPLMVIPACVWVIGRRLHERNREHYRRTLYGSSRRALVASILTTVLLLGFFVGCRLSLR